MTIHPARVVAGVLLIAGGVVVGVTALAIVLARLLVDGGMRDPPGRRRRCSTTWSRSCRSSSPSPLADVVAAAGLLVGTRMGRHRALARRRPSPRIGRRRPRLPADRRPRSVRPVRVRPRLDAIDGHRRSSAAVHRRSTCVGHRRASPSARPPPASDRTDRSMPHDRDPPRPCPRYAHRRGTRGFAAFVDGPRRFVVLGVGAVVLPTAALDSTRAVVAHPADRRLRARPLRRGLRADPPPRVERSPGRLPRRDRHRRRGLRPAADADRRWTRSGRRARCRPTGPGPRASAC